MSKCQHHTKLCSTCSRGQMKCDGTGAETRFRLSANRTSPFKSAGASVQSTTGSRGVHISGSNAGYTTFWGSVKGTGYTLHSPVSPSLPLPCVTVCQHVSAGVYFTCFKHIIYRVPMLKKKINDVYETCSSLRLILHERSKRGVWNASQNAWQRQPNFQMRNYIKTRVRI